MTGENQTATPTPVQFSIGRMRRRKQPIQCEMFTELLGAAMKRHDAALDRLEPLLSLADISVLDDLRAAVSPIKVALLDYLLDQALSRARS